MTRDEWIVLGLGLVIFVIVAVVYSWLFIVAK
jgi:hypothetical protein